MAGTQIPMRHLSECAGSLRAMAAYGAKTPSDKAAGQGEPSNPSEVMRRQYRKRPDPIGSRPSTGIKLQILIPNLPVSGRFDVRSSPPSLDWPSVPGGRGVFMPRRHDRDQKTVFGT